LAEKKKETTTNKDQNKQTETDAQANSVNFPPWWSIVKNGMF